MTRTIKMPNSLKELLKIQGVSAEAVGMIEDYYSGIVNETVAEYEKQQPVEEPKKTLSIQEMAKNARLIK